MRSSGYFFIGVSVLTAFAFWHSYIKLLPGDFPIYTHLHALFMTAWLGMLITQPFLIRAQRRAAHRAIGKASYALVPAIAWASLSLTHYRLRITPPAQATEALRGAYLPIAMLVLFLVAYVLAIRYRRNQALHSRFMGCTALGLADPIVARFAYAWFPELADVNYYPLITYAVIVCVLGVLMIRERDQRTARWAFPTMLAVTTLIFALWFTLAQTDAWVEIARAFGRLPLT